MEKNDWKLIGQLLSRLQDLYALVRDTLAEMRVGTEIIPWLMSNGKESLVGKIKALGTEFDAARRIRLTDNKNVIWVNLDAPPKLPFEGAEVVENSGGGWARVEKRKDGLYVNNKKIILHLDECQKNGRTIKGLKLREVFTGKSVEHPNILDALIAYSHLIPDDFKQDEEGRPIYIYFWAVIYLGSSSRLFVRCLYWLDDEWRCGSGYLGGGLGVSAPAALRES